jgi:hypothetical protein
MASAAAKLTGFDVGQGAVEVVLCEPHRVHAEFFGLMRIRERFLKGLMIARLVGGVGKQECAEFHELTPPPLP